MTILGSRVRTYVAWAAVALSAGILGGVVLAWVWPYDSIRTEPYELVGTGEVTSDGMIVVREGSPVVYRTEFCNEGVDVRLARWADQYGPYFDGAGDQLSDAGEDERSVSYPMDVRDFYSIDPGCGTATAKVVLSPPFPANRIYRVRTTSRYEANPLRTVSVSNETEPFLYLARDAPIP